MTEVSTVLLYTQAVKLLSSKAVALAWLGILVITPQERSGFTLPIQVIVPSSPGVRILPFQTRVRVPAV